MPERRLPSPSPDALTAPLDDDAVVLDLASARYYHLNAAGTAVWDGLAAGDPRDAIAARLATAFAVTHDEAAHAVDAFVAELRAFALVRDGVTT